MYVISGKKRESSPFRHIVKSLMHPYSVRSGYIRFPTVTNHQGFAQFGLSGRQGKIKYCRPRLQHSEIFRKNHFFEIPVHSCPTASCMIAIHGIHWKGYRGYI